MTLCDLLDAAPLKHTTHFWLNATGTDQLLAFIKEGENTQFVYPWGLRPWLQLAFQRTQSAKSSLQKSVSLTGLGSIQSFAENLRTFLSIKTVTTVTKATPAEVPRGGGIDFLLVPPRDKDVRGFGKTGIRIANNQSPNAEALMYARANTSRRTVVLITSTALTRSVGAEVHARAALIYSKRLEASISLPPSIMGAHVLNEMALLVVAPDDHELNSIAFLNAGHKALTNTKKPSANSKMNGTLWADLLSAPKKKSKGTSYLTRLNYGDITGTDFSLAPARHLEKSAFTALTAFNRRNNSRPLRDVATLIRPRALKHHDGGPVEVREAGISDIGADGFLAAPAKALTIEGKSEGIAVKQVLYPRDVVFSIKGRVGAVGIVPPAFGADDGAYWVAGQSLMILRPTRWGEHAEIVIYSYLTHPVVQNYISTLVTGTTSDTITQADIESIPIVAPTRLELEGLLRSFRARMAKFKEIEMLRASILEEKHAAWPRIEESHLGDERDPFEDEEFWMTSDPMPPT